MTCHTHSNHTLDYTIKKERQYAEFKRQPYCKQIQHGVSKLTEP